MSETDPGELGFMSPMGIYLPHHHVMEIVRDIASRFGGQEITEAMFHVEQFWPHDVDAHTAWCCLKRYNAERKRLQLVDKSNALWAGDKANSDMARLTLMAKAVAGEDPKAKAIRKAQVRSRRMNRES